MNFISSYFKFSERRTDLTTETRAGLTIYLTMAYILFVNPLILSDAGVPFNACVAGTALAAGISCILMGLITNFPLALASGMGLNSVLTYTVVKGCGLSWQTGMGLIFLDGLLVLLLVLVGIREAVMNCIPDELKHAIAVGIGIFLAFIGFFNAGFVTINKGAMIPMAGHLNTPGVAVAAIGLLIISALVGMKVRGGILIGILANTAIAMALGVAKFPEKFIAVPDFSTIGALDIRGALNPSLITLLIGFVIVDFFDTIGTVTAIGYQAGLVDEKGKIENSGKILGLDAVAAMTGGLCGASSVTAYIESAAGVSEGGRTGMTSISAGILFLLSVFIAPLAGIVPKEATAPALIIIGFMMMESLMKIDFSNAMTGIPAFVTMITMPFTYSISHGVGFGFITYSILKIVAGKASEVHPLMYIITVIFIASFIAM